MGKRSDGQFERVDRGFYPTPRSAVLPLLPYLRDVKTFCEPCAGNGALIGHLEAFGYRCGAAYDLEPQAVMISQADALALDAEDVEPTDAIITNPPWPEPRKSGQPTLALIRRFAHLKPTWLLLSADFAHNAYAGEVMAYCHKVVSIGRVKWIEGTEHEGKDNCAWYLFDASRPGPTTFHARSTSRIVYQREIEDLL